MAFIGSVESAGVLNGCL